MTDNEITKRTNPEDPKASLLKKALPTIKTVAIAGLTAALVAAKVPVAIATAIASFLFGQ